MKTTSNDCLHQDYLWPSILGVPLTDDRWSCHWWCSFGDGGKDASQQEQPGADRECRRRSSVLPLYLSDTAANSQDGASNLKHCKNRKTLPREHLIGCQGVEMFLLKAPFKFVLLYTFTFVIRARSLRILWDKLQLLKPMDFLKRFGFCKRCMISLNLPQGAKKKLGAYL